MHEDDHQRIIYSNKKTQYNPKVQQDNDLFKLLYTYILVYNRFTKKKSTKGL